MQKTQLKLSQSQIYKLPEHFLSHDDAPKAEYIEYYRFKDFYGGYLIFRLHGKMYRQYLSWTSAQRIFNKTSPFNFPILGS
jgi:hypothetical protein